MSTTSNIAIIGPGKVGAALGERFANHGNAVRFGVREGKDISEILARCAGRASADAPERAAAWADVIFLAVPGTQAVAAAVSLGDLAGKIVVDCNNPVRWEDGPVWDPPAGGSITAALAKACAGARMIKGFNTFGAEFHADPVAGDRAVQVFLAGDDAGAKTQVRRLAQASGFAPVDAGPLRNAAVLENLAVLWIHLATVGGRGRDFVFNMVHR